MIEFQEEKHPQPYLGDGDSLLFHDFVDGHAVEVAHLVKLVDADDATVGQHHGTGLEPLLARVLVCGHRRRQTDARGAATSGGDAVRCRVLHKAQQLRLAAGRVAHHQYVHVTERLDGGISG